MKTRLNIIGAAILLLVAFYMTGCASAPSEPVRDAGFVDSSALEYDPSVPFSKVWTAPGFDKNKYSQIYVADVNTDHMLGLTGWQEFPRKDDLIADVKKLAVYTKEAYKKAFREEPQNQFKVIDAPTRQQGALILEMALTEVVPSKVAMNTLGYAPFGIGLAINSVRRMSGDVSTVAIEARIKDAATGEIVAMFADRMTQQVTIVTVDSFTWYGYAHGIIDNMAVKLVKMANRKKGEVVENTPKWNLKPW